MKYIFMLFCLVQFIFGQNTNVQKTLDELIQNEINFSNYSNAYGHRNGFLKFMSDNCINFVPEPTNTKKWILADTNRLSFTKATLIWRPLFSDVSFNCDLGYTYGPAIVRSRTDSTKIFNTGYFFTVWKKFDNEWKAVLDMGVKGININYDEGLTENKNISKKAFGNISPEKIESINKKLSAKNSQKHLSSNGVILFGTDGKKMTQGEFVKYLSETKSEINFESMFSGKSESNDLVYSYGKYEVKNKNISETSYYTRVWKQIDKNRWVIVALVLAEKE